MAAVKPPYRIICQLVKAPSEYQPSPTMWMRWSPGIVMMKFVLMVEE